MAAMSLVPTLGASPATIGLLSFAGFSVGSSIDIASRFAPDSKIGKTLRAQIAIQKKLKADFRNSSLHSMDELVRSRDAVLSRIRGLPFANASDPRLRCARNFRDLQYHLNIESGCWNGRPSNASLEILRSESEIIVNSSTINIGIEAALLMMRDEWGLPLKVITGHAHGIEQVARLNEGDDADFVILSDTNMFTSGSNTTASKYRYLIPCGWQQHVIVSRGQVRRYHQQRIWYAPYSSGQEQIALGQGKVRDFSLEQQHEVDIGELAAKAIDLDVGEHLIAWDPLATLIDPNKNELTLSPTTDYRLSTSLYCRKDLAKAAKQRVRNAFQECFISAWNLSRIYNEHTLLELSLRSGYRRHFSQLLSSHM